MIWLTSIKMLQEYQWVPDTYYFCLKWSCEIELHLCSYWSTIIIHGLKTIWNITNKILHNYAENGFFLSKVIESRLLMPVYLLICWGIFHQVVKLLSRMYTICVFEWYIVDQNALNTGSLKILEKHNISYLNQTLRIASTKLIGYYQLISASWYEHFIFSDGDTKHAWDTDTAGYFLSMNVFFSNKQKS